MTTRYWTCHWQNRYWRDAVYPGRQLVNHSAGASFAKRGVSPGDVAYAVSLSGGQLLLGGRMTVGQILGLEEAVAFFGDNNIYEAPEHLIAADGSGTFLDLHRRLSPELTKRLRFESKTGPKEPCFVSDTELDNQATRGVRELTPASAALLDQIIALSDQNPDRDGELVVTEAMLQGHRPARGDDGLDTDDRLPEEVSPTSTYAEGAVWQVLVNRYERDRKACQACKDALGDYCHVCGITLAGKYGPAAAGYIHVHHLKPISNCGGAYTVDPVRDLLPVCPNCHAVIHRRDPPYGPDEVREMLRQHAQA